MGMLRDGIWTDDWYDTKRTGGRFVREDSTFRGEVTADGSSGFPAAAGRYHLYVSLACPWAHRVLIVRALKRLDAAIGVTVVEPVWGPEGWTFAAPDPHEGARHLHQLYTVARPDYTGRATVPILWDTVTRTIVCNESSVLMRTLNRAFDAFGDPTVDLYPEPLRADIDAVNALVYERVNNGVYRTGFATTQAAYEEAFDALFAALDELEARLGHQAFLVGDQPTEADWRLFTTLVRFDAVYVGHFKCNLRRLVDYPALWAYTRALCQVPGVAETVDLDHIKRHYYGSHPRLNPSGVVPKGPLVDLPGVRGACAR